DPAHSTLYEPAAIALAESRLPEVVELLNEKWTSTFDREFKKTLLLPMALTRSDAASDFLISILETGELSMSTAAITALRIYRGDPGVRTGEDEAIGGPAEAELRFVLRRDLD